MTPRTLITLALMQLLTIFVGVLLTAIFLRFLTLEWPNEPAHLPGFPRFMRNDGLWFCLLPVAWTVASVFSVRSLDALPQVRRAYLLAGYALWASLALTFFVSVEGAYETAFGYRSIQMQTP